MACSIALLASGAVAQSQVEAQSQTARQVAADPFVCGIAAGDGPRTDYFADLCRAFGIAIFGDGVELTLRLDSDEALVRWLERGASVQTGGGLGLAIGLPLETRSDVDIRYGPPVLIGDHGRWALAYAPGADASGERISWLFYALVQAEAYGVGSETSGSVVTGADAERFARYGARLEEQLGLESGAIGRMVREVGNHGEIYRRNLGDDPGVNLPVELGGQLFAPPVGGD